MTHRRTLHIGPFVAGERPLPLEYQFLDADGDPLNITGYTVKFVMRERHGLSVTYNGSLLDAANGKVVYTWTGTEMLIAGRWEAEFTVENAGNRFVSLRLVFDVVRPVGPTAAVTEPALAGGWELTRAMTGPRSGHVLVVDPGDVNGDIFLETPGQVYVDKIVQGRVFVRANNVVIRDCIIRHGISNNNAGTDFPCVIEYTRVGANNDGSVPTAWRQDDGMKFTKYSMYRCSIEGFSDGAKINGGGARHVENYIRCWQNGPSDHSDGVQNVGGAGITELLRCNVDARAMNSADLGNAAGFYADFGAGVVGTQVIQDNLLAGGGGPGCLCLHDGGLSASLIYVVTGNRLVRATFTQPLSRGAVNTTPLGQIVWEDNVYSDNLEVIPLV